MENDTLKLRFSFESADEKISVITAEFTAVIIGYNSH